MAETPHRRFRPTPLVFEAGNAWESWEVSEHRAAMAAADEYRALDLDGPRR